MSVPQSLSAQELPTIGVPHLGEMGAALAKVFLTHGARVISTVEQRSERTQKIALATGVELLSTRRGVLQHADILLSTVVPAAASQLAEEVCRDLRSGTIFLDANSVAPSTINSIAQSCAAADVELVDMAIRGLASKLPDQGAVYLSGRCASQIAPLLHPVEVEILGDQPGAASLLKMLMSGMSKGVAAQFIELALAAERAGILERFQSGVRRYYPDIAAAMEQVLPTYPQHVGRRAQELAEVENCLRELGRPPEVTSGGKRLFENLAAAQLSELAASLQGASVSELIQLMAQQTANPSETSFPSASSS